MLAASQDAMAVAPFQGKVPRGGNHPRKTIHRDQCSMGCYHTSAAQLRRNKNSEQFLGNRINHHRHVVFVYQDGEGSLNAMPSAFAKAEFEDVSGIKM